MSGSASSRTNGRRSTKPSSGWVFRAKSCCVQGRRRRLPPSRRRRHKASKMTAVIEARGLAKSYGGTRALDGVSFTVEPGRIVGLIGPNGAGKTSALKAILGLTPFAGELRVLGQGGEPE